MTRELIAALALASCAPPTPAPDAREAEGRVILWEDRASKGR